MRRLTLMMVAMALLAAGPAAAAEMRQFELGVFGGFYFADSTAGVDDDFVYGLRAGIVFTPVHELELVYDRVSTTFNSIDVGDLDEEFTSISLRWVFNFPRPSGRFVPFGAIGIGIMNDEIDPDDKAILPADKAFKQKEDDDTLLTIGGGFRSFFGDNMALRVEGRLKSFRTFGVSQDNFEITLGLTWVLGRRP